MFWNSSTLINQSEWARTSANSIRTVKINAIILVNNFPHNPFIKPARIIPIPPITSTNGTNIAINFEKPKLINSSEGSGNLAYPYDKKDMPKVIRKN